MNEILITNENDIEVAHEFFVSALRNTIYAGNLLVRILIQKEITKYGKIVHVCKIQNLISFIYIIFYF